MTKKYEIIEITWEDTHTDDGTWKDNIDEWIKDGAAKAEVKTIGYFLQEDENFIRVCQSYDKQGLVSDCIAVAKPCIKEITKL